MFFEQLEDGFINSDLFRSMVSRELLSDALGPSLDVTPFGLRSVPTHTEDGIPIRKLYVSNIPAKTTRKELFGVFAQHGFIKSCWLKMGEKGPNRFPAPTYAFVTYSNPADAHKALQAPSYEMTLRDRVLRISPADSWHQPVEDSDGRVRWKPRGSQRHNVDSPLSASSDQIEGVAPESSSDNGEAANSDVTDPIRGEEESECQPCCYTILDILNRDCLTHVLTYVPVRDLIRSERVSKAWRNIIQEYLQSIRTFKTSWWQHSPVTLTTAVLRRVLQRVGGSLIRLHIDHHWSALNDRTAHTVGRFCPNLEELKVVGMLTKNWNPLIYGCKELKNLAFVSCNKLTDSSLVHLVKSESNIESLTVANNTHVTGLFLTAWSHPLKLQSLAFYNCYSLQGTVLSAAIDTLPSLTTLKLNSCPVSLWKLIPSILAKLPRLQELSLCDYMSGDACQNQDDSFCKSFATLTELRILNLNKNIYTTNSVLKQVSQSCQKLKSLNVASCNSRKNYPYPGVGDEGIAAVCRGCPELSALDVSYLAALTDAGVEGAARALQLRVIVARGGAALSASPFARCIASCVQLEEIDVCGCDGITEDLIASAVQELQLRPRHLKLWMGGTAGATITDHPKHKLLTVNLVEDRSNPHLRPDFVDRFFEDDSEEDSIDDLYDHDDFEDLLDADDLFLDEDDLDEMYEFQLGPDLILY